MRSHMQLLSIGVVTAVVLCGCGRRPANPPLPNVAIAPAADDGPGVPGPVDDNLGPDGRRIRAAANGAALKLQKLVGRIPKDKQPKLGPEALIERNDAKDWLAQNMAGTAIEFSLRVKGIDIQNAGEGRYNLDLHIGTDTDETKRMSEGVRVESLSIGDVRCQVEIRCPTPMWKDLDSATARKYRDLKNKQAVFQAYLDEAEFQEAEGGKELVFRIVVGDPMPVEFLTDRGVPKEKEVP